MRIDLQSDFIKRLITSLILITLLIGIFNWEYWYLFNHSCCKFFSFLEIYNLKHSKVKLYIYVPFIIILYFLISKSEILNLFNEHLLSIFYTLSSLFVIISLFHNSKFTFQYLDF